MCKSRLDLTRVFLGQSIHNVLSKTKTATTTKKTNTKLPSKFNRKLLFFHLSGNVGLLILMFSFFLAVNQESSCNVHCHVRVQHAQSDPKFYALFTLEALSKPPFSFGRKQSKLFLFTQASVFYRFHLSTN